MKNSLLFASALLILLLIGSLYLTPNQSQDPKADQQMFPRDSLVLLKSAGQEALGQSKRASIGNFAGKYVLANFWASWCKVCATEKPFLRELQLMYHKRGFTVLGIATHDELRDIEESGLLSMMTFPVLFDASGKVIEQLGTRALPASVLIDPQGKIIHIYSTAINAQRHAELKAKLDAVLK
jgi:peroxiredoxin